MFLLQLHVFRVTQAIGRVVSKQYQNVFQVFNQCEFINFSKLAAYLIAWSSTQPCFFVTFHSTFFFRRQARNQGGGNRAIAQSPENTGWLCPWTTS